MAVVVTVFTVLNETGEKRNNRCYAFYLYEKNEIANSLDLIPLHIVINDDH